MDFINWKFVWFDCLHFWISVNWVHCRSVIFCFNLTGMHTLSFLLPSRRSWRWSRAQRTSPNSTAACSECWNTSNISQSLKVSVLISCTKRYFDGINLWLIFWARNLYLSDGLSGDIVLYCELKPSLFPAGLQFSRQCSTRPVRPSAVFLIIRRVLAQLGFQQLEG